MDLSLPALIAEFAAWTRGLPGPLAPTAGAIPLPILRPLDLAFCRFIQETAPEDDPEVLLAAALTSAQGGQGHVCLDLTETLAAIRAGLARAPNGQQCLLTGFAAGSVADWAQRLSASRAVENRLHRADDPPSNAGSEAQMPQARPLVLGGTWHRPLLYLRRYWAYEQQILAGIRMRLERPILLDEGALRSLLDRLFADDPKDLPPWARIACALAARSAFAVITGGPGSGKTTAVARLLALFQGLALASGDEPPVIRLAAPTGKAAARLNEALARFCQLSPPPEATTLDRLLGLTAGARRFRYHSRRPLDADLVVVDESSMIDVERLAALFAALRPEARLILIGDKDQLASVEAGAVLGDLCRRAQDGHYTPETCDWIERICGVRLPESLLDPDGRPLDQAIAVLRTSLRFCSKGGIGALAELVNRGGLAAGSTDPLAGVESLFRQAQGAPQSQGAIWRICLSDLRDRRFEALIRGGYWQGLGADGQPVGSGSEPEVGGYLQVLARMRPPPDADPEAFAAWAQAVLRAQAHFQVLTPLRQGPWGVEWLNQRIQHLLAQGPNAPLAGTEGRTWFEGRPVMVTRNDYALGLMNGDMGVALRVPWGAGSHEAMRLRVAFLTSEGIRWVLPSRLQAVETAFAMTVHKSQGSEFTHVALVLPDADSPVLTRELLYTGITRARSSLTLIYRHEAVLRAALNRQIERFSGLALALHEGA